MVYNAHARSHEEVSCVPIVVTPPFAPGGPPACFAMKNSHAELVRRISETLSDMQEDLEDACIGPIRKFLCISRRVAAVFDEYLLAEVHLERGTKMHA